MRRSLLPFLVCAACRAAVHVEPDRIDHDEVMTGTLRCTCGEPASITDGVPIFRSAEALSSRTAGIEQIRESFSFKWQRLPQFGFDRARVSDFYDEWFARKLGLSGVPALSAYLGDKHAFLDAGTGLGPKVATFCRANVNGIAIGVDVSDSVFPAFANTRAWTNAHIVQADLMRLPLPADAFDLIVSDGVLHHTPDAPKAFEALVRHLAPGGEIAIHVYRRLGPLREFCDDLLRAQAVALQPEACWEFTKALTRLGEALANAKALVDIPEDVPALGIKAGRYDVQRLFYYHVVKCFWNDAFTFDENNLVNFDWYHPVHASRHTEDEVEGWFRDAGLTDIRTPRANENGVSVIGRRPLR
jgi:SAM-dependent methyltransferase